MYMYYLECNILDSTLHTICGHYFLMPSQSFTTVCNIINMDSLVVCCCRRERERERERARARAKERKRAREREKESGREQKIYFIISFLLPRFKNLIACVVACVCVVACRGTHEGAIMMKKIILSLKKPGLWVRI